MLPIGKLLETVLTMRKLPAYLLAILVGGIIWFFFSHFKIEGTENVRVVPKTEEELNRVAAADAAAATDSGEAETGGFLKGLRDFVSVHPEEMQDSTISEPVGASVQDASTDSTQTPSSLPMKTTNLTVTPPRKRTDTIRIGSFHLYHFGSAAADPGNLQIVAKIASNFDIIAIQGIAPSGKADVLELAKILGTYEAILAKPADVLHQDERFAYLFNRETIVADRGVGLYTLGDEDNLLTREPLVGWFRAKQAPEKSAFTFSLVNVNTDQARAAQELDVLDNAMHEIRNDGREEDDVILLGSFQSPHNQLGGLGRVSSLQTAIMTPATDLLGKTQTENIVFRSLATDEYTERSGVFNYRQAFNLSVSEAQEVSDYLPVWAEFSIYETGQPH